MNLEADRSGRPISIPPQIPRGENGESINQSINIDFNFNFNLKLPTENITTVNSVNRTTWYTLECNHLIIFCLFMRKKGRSFDLRKSNCSDEE